MCMYYLCNSSFSIFWLHNSQQGHDQRNEGHGPLWPSSSPPPPPPHHWPLKYTRSTRSTFLKDSNTQNIYWFSLLVSVGPSGHPFQRHILISSPCFPSLFLWAPQIQIRKEYQVTLFKDSSNTQNLYWLPLLVFVGPSKSNTQGLPGHPFQWLLKYTKHMGQFLQGGKNGRLMSFFFKSRASVWPNLMR